MSDAPTQSTPTLPPSALRQSPETGELVTALCEALPKLHNPPKNKTVDVPGKFSYKYATLDRILDIVRPALAEHGIVLLQPITTNDEGKVVLLTRLLHRSGQWMESSIPLPMPSGDNKAFGGASTYLRRYGITSALGLAGDEDDDNTKAHHDNARVSSVHRKLPDDPVQALTVLADQAEDVDAGTDLLRRWAANAGPIEALRGRPEWGRLVQKVGVGLRASLGGVPASAFVRALRMEGKEDKEAFEAMWGGEWAPTLMAMQDEAPEVYRMLQGHVVSQIRRVTPSAAAPEGPKPGRAASA